MLDTNFFVETSLHSNCDEKFNHILFHFLRFMVLFKNNRGRKKKKKTFELLVKRDRVVNMDDL